MKKLVVAAGFLLAATPAFAAEYCIVQNPRTKACTVMEGRPAPAVAPSSALGTSIGPKPKVE